MIGSRQRRLGRSSEAELRRLVDPTRARSDAGLHDRSRVLRLALAHSLADANRVVARHDLQAVVASRLLFFVGRNALRPHVVDRERVKPPRARETADLLPDLELVRCHEQELATDELPGDLLRREDFAEGPAAKPEEEKSAAAPAGLRQRVENRDPAKRPARQPEAEEDDVAPGPAGPEPNDERVAQLLNARAG